MFNPRMIPRYTDHAATERTFLAWVRTTIAVVGFGFAASRLGGATPSGWADAVVLGAGALVVGLAYVRMRLIRARIDSPAEADDEGAPADAMLALLVIAFFGLLASFALRLSV
jgi:putative membrane protein